MLNHYEFCEISYFWFYIGILCCLMFPSFETSVRFEVLLVDCYILLDFYWFLLFGHGCEFLIQFNVFVASQVAVFALFTFAYYSFEVLPDILSQNLVASCDYEIEF